MKREDSMALNLATTRPQTYSDPWNNNKPISVNFKGRCVICKRTTYLFSDGSGDPRGPLTPKHAASTLQASEYNATGPDVPLCFDCGNTRETYNQALAIARTRWVVAS